MKPCTKCCGNMQAEHYRSYAGGLRAYAKCQSCGYKYDPFDCHPDALERHWNFEVDRQNCNTPMTQIKLATLRGKARENDALDEARAEKACSLGVGCGMAGACYASANGRPDMCGRN